MSPIVASLDQRTEVRRHEDRAIVGQEADCA
jgi:hypothetical protein